MTKISFTIPGRIGGKGRHRSAIIGGRIRTYTPKATQTDEGIVKHFAAQAMRGVKLLQGPLDLAVTIYRHPPQSWPKKKQAAAQWIAVKPDASNTLKLLEDAMNRIVWRDDGQIAMIELARIYSVLHPECITVTVTELAP